MVEAAVVEVWRGDYLPKQLHNLGGSGRVRIEGDTRESGGDDHTL